MRGSLRAFRKVGGDVQGNKVSHSKGLIGGLVALLPGLLNETWTKTAGDNITDLS